MSMNLTVEFLTGLAKELESLKAVRSNVKTIEYSGHQVILKRTDDQREGVEYTVIGIVGIPTGHTGHTGKLHGSTGNCR